MKFDVIGRINNMRLPDGKTALLYSVYEAVSNSIHAINDRFSEENATSKGKIRVDISVDQQDDIDTISITDNGIGFTPENIRSFETSDSRFKYQRGGKGVGRFIWFKIFELIKIDSVVKIGKSKERVRFTFDPQRENSIVGKRTTKAQDEDQETIVTLAGLRPEQRGRMRPSSYLKDLALHFFPQYVAGTLPEVEITYKGGTSSLNEFIADKVEKPKEETIETDFGEGKTKLQIAHLFVDSSISTGLRNAYLLTAHGRLVGDPISIERKYALNELPDNKAYVAVVSGDFLDERVDQERLGFKLTTDQREILDKIILDATERFLKAHIDRLRARQKVTVESVVKEHPQLATQFANIDDYVAGLSPGMDDEQIGQNLFVLLYREEKDLRRRIHELDQLSSLEPKARQQAEEILQEISNQEKHRLAELVVKRHQVLQMANLLLKYEDEHTRSHHYERVIHDLICPMGQMYQSGEYFKHNLWVLDDSLSGYELFASDKRISALSDKSASKKEPDIIFFNPLGFRREGASDPVVIVEFKRPGDERPSQDPVDQVLGYIEELRGASVRDVDGGVVSNIDERTPFECIIVCELTDTTRKQFGRSIAQNPTPDGEGYYGYSKPHNAYVRAMSFRKMLRDAERRNQAFFDALDLDSPSLAAKKRAARARERLGAKSDGSQAEGAQH
jgi:hypothetical protein